LTLNEATEMRIRLNNASLRGDRPGEWFVVAIGLTAARAKAYQNQAKAAGATG